MSIYELGSKGIIPLDTTTFAAERIAERGDIQRYLRDQIEVVAPGCMVLDEEFGRWEDSKRRIDLLCVDKQANLAVVELKRSEDGGAMELQALRYAAMVSTMTFEQAVDAHAGYLRRRGIEGDSRERLLGFLGWDASEPGEFAEEVRIVLVAADFSRELTTSVMWLIERELDIRCVQLRPYRHQTSILLDIQQVLPLREAEEYQVRLREKKGEERRIRESGRDYTKYDVIIDGVRHASLPKRHAAFRVIKRLCDLGHDPEAIREVVDRPPHNLWTVVPGNVGQAEFLRTAQADARAEGRAFAPHRRFTDDDQLIHVGDKTYALTNQWGAGTEEALEGLKARFPDSGIEVLPSEGT
jgi:hypothetical protein